MFKNIVRQFMKFSIVGASNVLVAMLAYYLLIHFGVRYIAANTIGYVLSILNAFIWNHQFVFRNQTQGSFVAPLIKTFLIYGISYFINTACLWLLVELCAVSDRIAPLIAVVVVVPINFLMNKYWVYRSTL
jgi:putative flippase GtrA